MNVYNKIAFLAFSSTLLLVVMSMVIVSPVMAVETFIWESWVYSTGVDVVSPILDDGRQYRIVAEEIWWYNYPVRLEADAQYYTTDNSSSWDWVSYLHAPGGHSFLRINGEDVDWGPFSNGDTGHKYTIYLIGSGFPLTFRLVDLINGYGNNVCHLVVRIYKDVRVGGRIVDSTPPGIYLPWIATVLTLAMVVTVPIIWYSRKS
jgi:hypothetical protein